MYPIFINFPDHPLTAWPVLAIIGAWAAYFSIRADLRNKNIPNYQIISFFLGAASVWFIGAYIGQILTVGRPMANFHKEFKISGFVLYGGVIATLLYGLIAWVVMGWRKKLPVEELWDFGALALAWALMFGRIGCTLNGCCYGTPAHSWPGYQLNETRWDYQNQYFPVHLHGIKLHPTPLYEAAGLCIIIGLLYWIRSYEERNPRTFSPGAIGWICWFSYGILRFLTEFIRMDNRGPNSLGLSPSQWIAFLTVILGAFMIRKYVGQSPVKNPME